MLFDECEPRVNIFRGLYAKFWLKIWLALASIFPNWEMGFFSESLQNACYITFSTFCATIETSPNGKQCTRCFPGPLPLSLSIHFPLFYSRCSIFHSFIWGTRQLLLEPSPGLSLTFFSLSVSVSVSVFFLTFHCLQFLIFRQPPLSSSLTQFELWPHGGRDVMGRERRGGRPICAFFMVCSVI